MKAQAEKCQTKWSSGWFQLFFLSVSSPRSGSYLALSLLFHCWFVTCGYQKGAGCHSCTGSHRDSSKALYPRAVTHMRWWSISSRAVLQRGKVYNTYQATRRGVQPLHQTSQPPHNGEVVVICLSYASKFVGLYKLKWGDSQTCLGHCYCSADTVVFVTSNLSWRVSSTTPLNEPDDHSCRAVSGKQGMVLWWRD